MERKIAFRGTHVRVKHPQRREFLLFILHDLVNRNLQKEKWADSRYAHSFWSHLGYAYDIIFDDVCIDTDPYDFLGYVFLDREEIEALKPVGKALDDILTIIGPEKPDSAYLNSPLWDRVVEAAQAALKVFMKNEEEAKKRNPTPWQGEDDWGEDAPSLEK